MKGIVETISLTTWRKKVKFRGWIDVKSHSHSHRGICKKAQWLCPASWQVRLDNAGKRSECKLILHLESMGVIIEALAYSYATP